MADKLIIHLINNRVELSEGFTRDFGIPCLSLCGAAFVFDLRNQQRWHQEHDASLQQSSCRNESHGKILSGTTLMVCGFNRG
ncbi:MAG: hypothetical protein WKF77_17340 [Planctomycetaceae bacterium]